MKASELISKLQKLVAENGDSIVVLSDINTGNHGSIADVSVAINSKGEFDSRFIELEGKMLGLDIEDFA